jgi:tetratricopeptide (TPR) repeat protein
VGETLALLRRYEEAEEWFRRAIDIRPDFALPYAYMSMMRLRSAGDTADARLWLLRMDDRGIGEDQDDFRSTDLDLIRLLPGAEDVAVNGRAALEGIRRSGQRPLANQFRYSPMSLLSGLARQRMGDSAGAEAAFDSARVELEALVASSPEESRYRSSLGLALAGLGRSRDAIREGREGLRLMPPEAEAWRGGYRVIDLARVYTMVGRLDEAVEQLEYVMSIPADLSVWELRLDPMWDPLRGHPRFEALAATD